MADLGYEPIPVEHDAPAPVQAEPAQPELPIDQPARVWTEDEIYAAVIDAGAAPDVFSAKGALAKCTTGWDTPAKAEAWLKIYRQWRAKKTSSDESAEHANNGELPQ
jgi:hypothetical protein